jgi:hypothetical protein
MKQHIVLTVGSSYKIHEEILKLTTEETEILIETGLQNVKNSKKMAIQIKDEDVVKGIQDAHLLEILNLKMDMTAMEKTNKLMNEREDERRIKEQGFYLKQIEAMRQNCDFQVKAMQEKIETEINRKSLIYDERTREIEKNRASLESALETINRLTGKTASSTDQGIVGEMMFEDLAKRTFEDIKCDIVYVGKVAMKGDFHMAFKEFSVIVDVKNYPVKNVNLEDRKKLMRDFEYNHEFHFGLMISLHSGVDRFDNGVITFEKLRNGKYIYYINGLFKSNEPRRLLKSVYLMMRDMKEREDAKTEEDRRRQSIEEDELRRQEHIANLKKELDDMKGLLDTQEKTCDSMRMVYEKMKKELHLLENRGADENANFTVFREWWNTHLIEVPEAENQRVSTKTLWNSFKVLHDTKALNMECNEFKGYIVDMLRHTQMTKATSKNGGFEVLNFKLKE